MRKFFANLLDRTFLIFFCSLIGSILHLDIISFILFFLLFDFLLFVVFRGVFARTPGDISFGIVIRTRSPSLLFLTLRWIIGYLSPLTGFLVYIPAEKGRSFCDFLLGIKTEIV